MKRSDSVYRNYVVDSVKIQLQEEYVYSMTRPYETVYDLKSKNDKFFNEMIDLYSFDDSMGLILGERDTIITQMDEFRESWSLQKFLSDQSPTNLSSVRTQDTKISAEDSSTHSDVNRISHLEAELVSKDTF